jgi:energy-coupling factor transporter ATP-binding protein EcfA2
MRLYEVTIGEFKNLRDLRVDFDEGSPYTVLVGENGAGKSNLIEALSLIFRNLDLDQEAPFSYHMKYQCRDHDIEIRATADQFPQFRAKRRVDTEYFDLPRKRYMAEDQEGRPLYRPAFVFGYYSGPSDRLTDLREASRALLQLDHQISLSTWEGEPCRPKQTAPLVLRTNPLRSVRLDRLLHGSGDRSRRRPNFPSESPADRRSR